MKKVWEWIKTPGVMAAVALFSIAIAIYTGFFNDKKPELTIRVDTLSPVFDLRQPVGGLSVSYAGEDLRSAKKALWVLKATFSNTGNAEIKNGDYDDRAPLGLNVVNAEIVDRPTIVAANPYLEKNLHVIAVKSGVTFSSVIFEPGDAVELTLLILGPNSTKPELAAVGKIAGVQRISLVPANSPEDPSSIWRQAIRGDSPWVHLLRAFIYFFGFIFGLLIVLVIVALIVTPFEALSGRRSKQQRQNRVREYRRHGELGSAARFLMDIYVEEGDFGFKRMAYTIERHRSKQHRIALLREKDVPDEEIGPLVIEERFPAPYAFPECTEKLRGAKLLAGEKLDAILAEDVLDSLSELAEFISIDLAKVFATFDKDRDFLYSHEYEHRAYALAKG